MTHISDSSSSVKQKMIQANESRIERGGDDMEPSKYFYLLDDEDLVGVARDPSNPYLNHLQVHTIDRQGLGFDSLDQTQIFQDVYGPDGNITGQSTSNKMNLLERLRNINDRVADLKDKIRQVREQTFGPIADSNKKIQSYLQEILNIQQTIAGIPREFFPYQLVRELRNTYCLFQSILSFPQYFKDSISQAYEDFLSLLKDSGCATTIRR